MMTTKTYSDDESSKDHQGSDDENVKFFKQGYGRWTENYDKLFSFAMKTHAQMLDDAHLSYTQCFLCYSKVIKFFRFLNFADDYDQANFCSCCGKQQQKCKNFKKWTVGHYKSLISSYSYIDDLISYSSWVNYCFKHSMKCSCYDIETSEQVDISTL